ncbi:50S ribosomal protein L25/general stress protein Ctc [Pelagibacteraceae bacterium]|nr:50S ribosomal protein L25/general stress protein Ctc [Pelagibacteraceae bacterium]
MTNNLKATKRESKTSGDLNNLRSKGFIPAILYGGNNPSLKITIEEKLLNKVLGSDSFLSTVIDLNIDGQTEKVIPRDISYNVISDKPIHIDFMRITKGSKIILQIPVIFKNNKDCPGLKSGGVLNIVRRKVELSCSAENIPENIIVDLANLEIGASIKISSVELPENAQPTITDRDFVVATIAAPTIVKEPEKPAEDAPAEGAEGEAAAAEGGEAATPSKEDDAAKKDEKGKDAGSDKKPASEKKQEKK